MRLFNRSPVNCAFAFDIFIKVFLVHLLLVLLIVILPLVNVRDPLLTNFLAICFLPLELCFLILMVILAYQIGFNPVIAVLWGCALFIPVANFILFFVLWIKTKNFLRRNGYVIALLGARLAPANVA